MKKTIGIIGGGVVGSALKNFFKDSKIYDKFSPLDLWEEVSNQDYIFICVPTPYKNGFDKSAVKESLERLKDLDNKVVIIKSTIVPGTTEKFQDEYKKLKILFNPEFLNNNTANEDFQKPDKQIVGYTDKSREAAEEVLDMLPKAPYSKICRSTIAEMVKYTINSYYAVKVIFANQIFDICQSLKIEYDEVREAFEHDKRVAPGNFDVWHSGYRGFNGKCLPKDLASLIDLAKEFQVDVSLLKEVQAINNALLAKRHELTSAKVKNS